MNAKPELTAHPLASLFPVMIPAEYAEFKKDIETNGLHEPIVLYEGQILDGRNRYQACCELSIELATTEYTGDDPIGFVLSKNLHRRHLDASQRALIAAQAADLKRGGARGKAQVGALTHAQAAERCGISTRQADKASALLNVVDEGRAIRELVEAVRSGERSLHWADMVSRLPIVRQRRLLTGDGPEKASSRAKRGRGSRIGEQEQIERGLERFFNRLLAFASDAEEAGQPSSEQRGRLRDLREMCDRVQGRLDDIRQRIEQSLATVGMPFEDA